MSMTAAVFFVMGIVATALGPEQRGAKFGE
jgi:hypothetical protein